MTHHGAGGDEPSFKVAPERHDQLAGVMATDGGDAEPTLAAFAAAGIDLAALALQLQSEGAVAFVNSWSALMQRIADKGAAPRP